MTPLPKASPLSGLPDSDAGPGKFLLAPEQPAETMIFEAEGLWIKQIAVAKAHTYLPQHAHVLSHLTLIAAGSVNVWIDGNWDARYDAPSAVYIRAGAKHTFETLVDGTVLYCVHCTATPEALKVLAEHDLLG